MKERIYIPSLGESIKEVKIVQVLKPSGAKILQNEDLIEIESEKLNQVIAAPCCGVITWSIEIGQIVSVGKEIGFIEKSSEPQKESLKDVTKPQKQEKPIPIQKSPLQKSSSMSSLRKSISKKFVQALHESAMVTTFNEVDMTEVLNIKEKFRSMYLEKYRVKLGLTSFFIKAVFLALQEFSVFNQTITQDKITQLNTYDLSIAMATDRGLVVPVIRSIDQLSFVQIEQTIDLLSEKAIQGHLTLDDITGGNFTITNGGIFGSLFSTPLLNPPQVGILGIHTIQKRAIVDQDRIVIKPMMYLALSYDHRLIDGKRAILFLQKIKQVIESFSHFFSEFT